LYPHCCGDPAPKTQDNDSSSLRAPDEDRTRGAPQKLPRDAPEEEAAPSAPNLRRHADQVGPRLARAAEDLPRGIAFDAPRLRGDVLELEVLDDLRQVRHPVLDARRMGNVAVADGNGDRRHADHFDRRAATLG